MFHTNLDFDDSKIKKRVKMAVCGIKYINFTTETIKILGVHFFYNQKSQIPKNLAKSTSNRQNVLNLWTMRNITLEGGNNNLPDISAI